MRVITFFILITLNTILCAQQSTNHIEYNIESTGSISNGNYAPLWLTANRYGMGSNENKTIFLRTGVEWEKKLKQNWQINIAHYDILASIISKKRFSISCIAMAKQ